VDLDFLGDTGIARIMQEGSKFKARYKDVTVVLPVLTARTGLLDLHYVSQSPPCSYTTSVRMPCKLLASKFSFLMHYFVLGKRSSMVF
jgi:hypothetical protein